jgi:hydroxymethylpyrimidine pyrophosphatase-like HAD family hydrolase
VFVGGAMVVDTKSGATVRRTLVESKLAAEICAFIESKGHAALALQDTGVADADYLATADAPLNESTERWIRATGALMQRVKGLGSHGHPHTVRLGIVASTAVATLFLDDLVAEFGQRIACHRVGVTPHGSDVLEIFGPSVSKWEGVRHIAEKYGIEQSQVIAVGDDVNDLAMIRAAGLGLAMGNAKPEVQAAADRVIGSNRDDGLAEVPGRARRRKWIGTHQAKGRQIDNAAELSRQQYQGCCERSRGVNGRCAGRAPAVLFCNADCISPSVYLKRSSAKKRHDLPKMLPPLRRIKPHKP